MILLNTKYVHLQLNDNLDSKTFWERLCHLLEENTLLTTEAMKLIFSLMKERLCDLTLL